MKPAHGRTTAAQPTGDGTPTRCSRTSEATFTAAIAMAKIAQARGESIDSVMRRGWPPVHFSRVNSFKAQATRWSEQRLGEAGFTIQRIERLEIWGLPVVACLAH